MMKKSVLLLFAFAFAVAATGAVTSTVGAAEEAGTATPAKLSSLGGLREENQRLEGEIERLIQDWKEAVRRLTTLLEERQQETGRVQEALEAARTELRRKDEDLATLGRTVDEVRRKLAGQEREEGGPHPEAAAIQELERALRAAEERERGNREKLSRLQTELDRSRESPARGAGRSATLERDLENARKDEQAARRQLETLQQAVSRQSAVATSEIETLQVSLSKAQAAEQELRRRVDSTRHGNEEIDEQVTALREQATRAHELEKELHEQEFRIQELEHSRETDRKQVRDLRIAKVKLEALVDEVRERNTASAKTLTALVARQAVNGPQIPAVEMDGPGGPQVGELRRNLDLERERRETLEMEVQRLNAVVSSGEQYRQAWKGLQTARAEVLVLTNRLAEERERREALEVAIQDGKRLAGVKGESADWLQKLVEASREQKGEAQRLDKELHEATETIVRLKGRLESVGSPEENSRVLTELESNNDKLRSDLNQARDSITRLRAQAELAQRLADIVYGKQD